MLRFDLYLFVESLYLFSCYWFENAISFSDPENMIAIQHTAYDVKILPSNATCFRKEVVFQGPLYITGGPCLCQCHWSVIVCAVWSFSVSLRDLVLSVLMVSVYDGWLLTCWWTWSGQKAGFGGRERRSIYDRSRRRNRKPDRRRSDGPEMYVHSGFCDGSLILNNLLTSDLAFASPY